MWECFTGSQWVKCNRHTKNDTWCVVGDHKSKHCPNQTRLIAWEVEVLINRGFATVHNGLGICSQQAEFCPQPKQWKWCWYWSHRPGRQPALDAGYRDSGEPVLPSPAAVCVSSTQARGRKSLQCRSCAIIPLGKLPRAQFQGFWFTEAKKESSSSSCFHFLCQCWHTWDLSLSPFKSLVWWTCSSAGSVFCQPHEPTRHREGCNTPV